VASNHNFVCFDCRVAVRRPKTISTRPPCPLCRNACTDIGYKIAVPTKDDADAWERLYVTLREGRRRHVLNQQEERVARIHALERQIERLSVLPTSAGRDRTIRELKKRLREA
jgi:hypothetical protein